MSVFKVCCLPSTATPFTFLSSLRSGKPMQVSVEWKSCSWVTKGSLRLIPKLRSRDILNQENICSPPAVGFRVEPALDPLYSTAVSAVKLSPKLNQRGYQTDVRRASDRDKSSLGRSCTKCSTKQKILIQLRIHMTFICLPQT